MIHRLSRETGIRGGRPVAEQDAHHREWRLRALAVLAGFLVPLGCLEALLWTLPVYDPPLRLAVDEANPVLRFEPHQAFVWSRGWDFSMVNAGRTNNYGFVSDSDYHPDAEGPLLAVIGDSYVEAAMVPFGQTCAGRLARKLAGTARVYPFGVSGSSLSQYLAFATYARDTFRPDGLAVVIIDNDYEESLLGQRPVPGFHYFAEGGDGRLHLERVDFERTLPRRLIRASALARYFAGNADVRYAGEQLRRRLATRWNPFGGEADTSRHGSSPVGSTEPPGGVGNRGRALPRGAGSADGEPARVTDSKRAVDAFLDRLPGASGLNPERIVFVVDGLRPQLYRNDQLAEMAGSFRDVMRRYFMAQADRRGFETADLQPAMAERYRMRREPFESAQDFHWNALGHEVCFDAVARSAVVSGGLRARGASAGGGLPAPRGHASGGFTEWVQGVVERLHGAVETSGA